MSDYREALALEIREVLGAYNDDDKPVIALIKDVVARADDKWAKEALSTPPALPDEAGSSIICPFCREGDFDLIGLKMHIERHHCDAYEELDTDPPQKGST